MSNHIVINQPENCCGCAACVNACSLNAITMKEDEAGYLYPAVDENVCVNCGKCISVCNFATKNAGANGEPEVYAAAINNKEVLKESSSGGIFTAVAQAVLDKGGAVFGAAWDNNLSLKHICVENVEDLAKLRGSKYVQSDIGNSFSRLKSLLKEGREVCFCGTPCQVAGLKSYLATDYENLFTIDIICHGVPNIKMLHDDLAYVSRKKNEKIQDVKFRDKQYGWGVKGSIKYGDSKMKYSADNSPYYFYFLKGEMYRDSCYNCRFPSENRQGDITLGDYWGIKQELIANLGEVDPDLGISCVLINTPKGRQMFEKIKPSLCSAVSDRPSVEKRNRQLTSSSKPLDEHKTLMDGYKNNGYKSIVDGYKKHLKDHVIRSVKNVIPSKIKRKLNDLLS